MGLKPEEAREQKMGSMTKLFIRARVVVAERPTEYDP